MNDFNNNNDGISSLPAIVQVGRLEEVDIWGPLGAPRESADVLLGRGTNKQFSNHPGNVRFHQVIHHSAETYAALYSSSTKKEKTQFIDTILRGIQLEGRRFLKKKKQKDVRASDEWYIMSNKEAHESIQHALRDELAAHRKAADEEPMTHVTPSPAPQQEEAESEDAGVLPRQASGNLQFEANLAPIPLRELPMIEEENPFRVAEATEDSFAYDEDSYIDWERDDMNNTGGLDWETYTELESIIWQERVLPLDEME
jgi:hypothetical protein